MERSTCPGDEALLRYVLGKLPTAEISTVASHVESCPDCERIATSLEQTPDVLLRRLRYMMRHEQFSGEPELWSMLIQLMGIGEVTPESGSSVTVLK